MNLSSLLAYRRQPVITVRLHFTVKRTARVIGLTVHLLGLCLLIG